MVVARPALTKDGQILSIGARKKHPDRYPMNFLAPGDGRNASASVKFRDDQHKEENENDFWKPQLAERCRGIADPNICLQESAQPKESIAQAEPFRRERQGVYERIGTAGLRCR